MRSPQKNQARIPTRSHERLARSSGQLTDHEAALGREPTLVPKPHLDVHDCLVGKHGQRVGRLEAGKATCTRMGQHQTHLWSPAVMHSKVNRRHNTCRRWRHGRLDLGRQCHPSRWKLCWKRAGKGCRQKAKRPVYCSIKVHCSYKAATAPVRTPQGPAKGKGACCAHSRRPQR
jgi:hypothetical protein